MQNICFLEKLKNPTFPCFLRGMVSMPCSQARTNCSIENTRGAHCAGILSICNFHSQNKVLSSVPVSSKISIPLLIKRHIYRLSFHFWEPFRQKESHYKLGTKNRLNSLKKKSTSQTVHLWYMKNYRCCC